MHEITLLKLLVRCTEHCNRQLVKQRKNYKETKKTNQPTKHNQPSHKENETSGAQKKKDKKVSGLQIYPIHYFSDPHSPSVNICPNGKRTAEKPQAHFPSPFSREERHQPQMTPSGLDSPGRCPRFSARLSKTQGEATSIEPPFSKQETLFQTP